MLLNKTITLFIAFSLLFPSHIFPANTLAPAGVGETKLGSEIAQESKDTETNIQKMVVEALNNGRASVRKAAALDIIEWFKPEHVFVIHPLFEALKKDALRKKNGDPHANVALLAEAETFLEIGNVLKSCDPDNAIKAVSSVLEKDKEGDFLVVSEDIHKRAGNFLIEIGKELASAHKWEKAFEAFFTASKVEDTDIQKDAGNNVLNVGHQLTKILKIDKKDKIIEAYIAALKYGETKVKKAAATNLGDLQPIYISGIEKRIDELKSKETMAGGIPLINKLKEIKNTIHAITVEALIYALRFEEVKDAVNIALFKVCNKENVKIVIDALEEVVKIERKDFRLRITKILLEIAKQKLIPGYISQASWALVAALKYGDMPTRTSAAEIIGNNDIHTTESVDALKVALTDDLMDVSIAAAKALGKLRDKDTVKPLGTSLTRLGSFAADALAKIGGEEARNILVATVKKRFLKVNVRVAAVMALSNMELTFLDLEAGKTIMNALTSRRPRLAEAAAWGLGIILNKIGKIEKIEGDSYVLFLKNHGLEALKSSLENDKRKNVRKAAAEALGTSKNSQANKVLVHALLSDKEPEVRCAAARALGEIGSPGVVTFLNIVILNEHVDVDVSVRLAAIEASGMIGSSESVDTLFIKLHDKMNGIRVATGKALEEIYRKLIAAKDFTGAAVVGTKLGMGSFHGLLQSL